MARWEDALDALLDAYTFHNSDFGKRMDEGWARAHSESLYPDGVPSSSITVDLNDRVIATLFNADAFWVDPDMQTLWESATKMFRAEPLVPQDLLAPTGFVYLPRPFTWTDRSGKAITFRAFAWARHAISIEVGPKTVLPDDLTDSPRAFDMEGITLLLFHAEGDVDDFDDGTRKDQRLFRGSLLVEHAMPWVFNASYGDKDPDGVGRGITVPVRRLADGTFESKEFRAEGVEKGSVEDDSPLNIQRPVQCLFRLMQQTIATRNEERAAKPWRRRWERAKLDERKVTVIRLRRPTAAAHDGEKREVEWTHRWLVSGHWRNQWHSSIQLHRQIWVSGYIKGPEDKPLDIRKARVFEFVR